MPQGWVHTPCTLPLDPPLVYTTADQSGDGSHFGLCSALPFLHNSLQFSLCCLSTKNKGNLLTYMYLLRRGGFDHFHICKDLFFAEGLLQVPVSCSPQC